MGYSRPSRACTPLRIGHLRFFVGSKQARLRGGVSGAAAAGCAALRAGLTRRSFADRLQTNGEWQTNGEAGDDDDDDGEPTGEVRKKSL